MSRGLPGRPAGPACELGLQPAPHLRAHLQTKAPRAPLTLLTWASRGWAGMPPPAADRARGAGTRNPGAVAHSSSSSAFLRSQVEVSGVRASRRRPPARPRSPPTAAAHWQLERRAGHRPAHSAPAPPTSRPARCPARYYQLPGAGPGAIGEKGGTPIPPTYPHSTINTSLSGLQDWGRSF